ncbi:hypothetical protein J2S53_002094 [Actinopolyspora lacussalsi]|nr:hypothetical protein [Actinopolyspora righensis]MDP9642149.1 hypothetical protein [Actinopolyspora lacussalsi]
MHRRAGPIFAARFANVDIPVLINAIACWSTADNQSFLRIAHTAFS